MVQEQITKRTLERRASAEHSLVVLRERTERYAALAARLAGVADYFVLNVSSPNTPGLRELQSGNDLRAILAAVRDTLRACLDEQFPEQRITGA